MLALRCRSSLWLRIFYHCAVLSPDDVSQRAFLLWMFHCGLFFIKWIIHSRSFFFLSAVISLHVPLLQCFVSVFLRFPFFLSLEVSLHVILLLMLHWVSFHCSVSLVQISQHVFLILCTKITFTYSHSWIILSVWY